MQQADFLSLSDAAVAAEIQASGALCWALAMGGTRRAYIADGGRLSSIEDLASYFDWMEIAQRRLVERLFTLGATTIIAIIRVPVDRGPGYAHVAREALAWPVRNPARLAFYTKYMLRVSAAGGLDQLGALLDLPELGSQYERLAETSAAAGGPRLIYLFRGAWATPGIEEVQLGYELSRQLGRMPSRDELVRAYYGCDVPPLSVYVGSGRPQVGRLRPPFLGGDEALYWSVGPLNRLDNRDWRRIIYDLLWSRRTHSARSYPDDAASRATISAALTEHDGQIIGLGSQHPLGFWIAG